MLAQQLAERVRAIAAEAAAPEDAIEPSLRAILEGLGACAGAVCLYDPQKLLLRLVAEIGLSDEGCRSLRNVRQGAATGWEMPLQSLLSQRAFLIDNPAENRYVPPLVDDQRAVETIACLPLYDGPSPVGSLVLVATKPSSLGEEHLQAVKGPQRELVAMIEALRKRAGQTRAPSSEPPPGTRGTDASAAGADRAATTAAPTPPPTSPTSPLGDARDQSAEIQRLLVQLAESRVAAAAQEQAIAAAKRTHDEQILEIGRLRADLAEAKAGLAAAEESAASNRRESSERHAEVARLQADLPRAAEAAAAREQDLLGEIERLHAKLGTAERDSATRGDELSAPLQAQRDGLAAEVERLRAELAETGAAASRTQELASASRRECESLAAETERLRMELDTARAAASAHQDELAALKTHLRRAEDALASRLEAASSREQIAREELAAALARERARAASLEAEAAGRERAHAAAIEELHAQASASAHARSQDAERIAALERQSADLAARVEAAAIREQSLGAEMAASLGAARVQEDALRAEIEALARTARQREAELEEARRAALAAEQERAELRAETATMRASLAEANARIETMQATIARLEAAAVRVPAPELETVSVAPREADAPASAEGPAAAAAAPEPDRPDPALASPGPTAASSARPTRSQAQAGSAGKTEAEVDAEAAAVPAQQPPASSDARLAIIDVAAPWRAVSLETHGVRIVTPEAASSLVDASSPHPILVNLAAPGALAAMAALRAAGATVSFLAYVAVAGTEKALRLGTTEVVGAPMDPDAVLAVLDGHVTRGTRVLAAGADADAVMSLRQALSRQGASVSMAWDCNQAKDLLAMTRPAVAVIDLDLPPRGGYALVAALADLDPLPTAVLVCQPGAEGGARLAAEAADRSRAARLVALQQLLNDLLRRG